MVDAKPNSPLREDGQISGNQQVGSAIHAQRTRVPKLAVVLSLTAAVRGGRGVGSKLGLGFLDVGHDARERLWEGNDASTWGAMRERESNGQLRMPSLFERLLTKHRPQGQVA